VTDNNYKQSVTGNANNVTPNAYVNYVYRHLLRSNVNDCVKLRYARFVNVLKPAKNTGICGENIVFYKTSGRRKAGIVKILLSTVRTFSTLLKCTNYAHQIFLKLQHVENTVLLSLRLALKIRVSVVRFRPRPPYTRRSKGNRATLFYCTNVARSVTNAHLKCCSKGAEATVNLLN
jgi:hypothetical protein